MATYNIINQIGRYVADAINTVKKYIDSSILSFRNKIGHIPLNTDTEYKSAGSFKGNNNGLVVGVFNGLNQDGKPVVHGTAWSGIYAGNGDYEGDNFSGANMIFKTWNSIGIGSHCGNYNSTIDGHSVLVTDKENTFGMTVAINARMGNITTKGFLKALGHMESNGRYQFNGSFSSSPARNSLWKNNNGYLYWNDSRVVTDNYLPTSTTNNVDITSPGSYYVNSGYKGTAPSGYAAAYNPLLTFGHVDCKAQFLTYHNSTSKLYFRTGNGPYSFKWHDWKQIAFTDYVDDKVNKISLTPGNGIKYVTYGGVTTSGGKNTLKLNYTDGTSSSEFAIYNGKDGSNGANGKIWKPTVASNGDISWTLTENNNTATPATQNIKGPQGNKGDGLLYFVYYLSYASGEPNATFSHGSIYNPHDIKFDSDAGFVGKGTHYYCCNGYALKSEDFKVFKNYKGQAKNADNKKFCFVLVRHNTGSILYPTVQRLYDQDSTNTTIHLINVKLDSNYTAFIIYDGGANLHLPMMVQFWKYA